MQIQKYEKKNLDLNVKNGEKHLFSSPLTLKTQKIPSNYVNKDENSELQAH